MINYPKILISIFFSFLLATVLDIDHSSASLSVTNDPVVHAPPFSSTLLERQKERFEASQADELCKALDIRKNMVILDIGTGSGQYAYKFAEALQGTGKVFATDINPKMVNYVRAEIEKRHLKNLTPVLVKADGVDDFYTRHRYDLIFIAHAMQYIPNRGNYLRQMKGYLNPRGRLVTLQYKFLGDFKPKDFTDLNGLLKKILKERPDSPFYKYVRALQPEAKRVLSGELLNRAFLLQIVECFNAMARDGHFFVRFLDKKDMVLRADLKISPQERVFINFNLFFFKEYNIQDAQRGVDLKNPHISWLNIADIKNINQSLILSEFHEFMYGGKLPFLAGGDIKREIGYFENEFRSYGYKLVQVYDFIPHEVLMEFLPQD